MTGQAAPLILAEPNSRVRPKLVMLSSLARLQPVRPDPSGRLKRI